MSSQKELIAIVIIEWFLDGELGNYSQFEYKTLKAEAHQWSVGQIDRTDVTVWVDINGEVYTFRVSVVDDDFLFEGCDDDAWINGSDPDYESYGKCFNIKIAVNPDQEAYTEIRSHDSSIKHFWMTILKWPVE